MQIAIVGLAGSGKTTVFNTLTRGHAETGGYGGVTLNVGVVKVPDERLDRLAEIFKPKKIVQADVTYVDLPAPPASTEGRVGTEELPAEVDVVAGEPSRRVHRHFRQGREDGAPDDLHRRSSAQVDEEEAHHGGAAEGSRHLALEEDVEELVVAQEGEGNERDVGAGREADDPQLAVEELHGVIHP